MCSPRLLDGEYPISAAEDLRRHVLLHDDSLDFDTAAPKWNSWLKAAGVATVYSSRGPHFSHPDHSLQAAIDGAGVVLGRRYLAAADLAAGRLVAPFELVLPMGLGFYLVCPEAHADRPKVVIFREWLLQEMGEAKQSFESR